MKPPSMCTLILTNKLDHASAVHILRDKPYRSLNSMEEVGATLASECFPIILFISTYTAKA